jgi:hypothetical protein
VRVAVRVERHSAASGSGSPSVCAALLADLLVQHRLRSDFGQHLQRRGVGVEDIDRRECFGNEIDARRDREECRSLGLQRHGVQHLRTHHQSNGFINVPLGLTQHSLPTTYKPYRSIAWRRNSKVGGKRRCLLLDTLHITWLCNNRASNQAMLQNVTRNRLSRQWIRIANSLIILTCWQGNNWFGGSATTDTCSGSITGATSSSSESLETNRTCEMPLQSSLIR